MTTTTHFAYDGDNAWGDFSGSNSLQMHRHGNFVLDYSEVYPATTPEAICLKR